MSKLLCHMPLRKRQTDSIEGAASLDFLLFSCCVRLCTVRYLWPSSLETCSPTPGNWPAWTRKPDVVRTIESTLAYIGYGARASGNHFEAPGSARASQDTGTDSVAGRTHAIAPPSAVGDAVTSQPTDLWYMYSVGPPVREATAGFESKCCMLHVLRKIQMHLCSLGKGQKTAEHSERAEHSYDYHDGAWL